MTTLHPADVILVHGRSRLSRWIRWAQPGPSWASHCAIAVDSVNIVEALSHGVVERRMPYPPSRVRIYRPLNIPQQELVRIAREAEKYRGRPYGWSKLVLHALGLSRFAFIDGLPICSWVVAAPYAKAGYTFGVDARDATPDSIHDFIVKHPNRYERIQ